MGMTPSQFFESFVEGNSDDCQGNPGCIRRAFNAAVAASHLADHNFTFNRRHRPEQVSRFLNLGDYVKHLVNQTGGAFRDIRSIANAYKHLYTDIDSRKAVYSSVSSSGSIELIELQCEDLNIGSISEEYMNHPVVPEFRSFVTFTRKDGTKSEFLPILNTVVDYWRTEI